MKRLPWDPGEHRRRPCVPAAGAIGTNYYAPRASSAYGEPSRVATISLITEPPNRRRLAARDNPAGGRLTSMHNLDVFSKLITTAIPDATLAVQDGHVQATAYVKGIGQRLVGCSVANAEKAPQTMAKRIIETFSKTDWTQRAHVFLAAVLPDGSP